MTRLSLTFDNGPCPGSTERVLEALAARNLTATFFMVGRRLLGSDARRTASLVSAAGHRIGNHTLSHGAPLGTDVEPGRATREISEMQSMLGDLAGTERLFRPNGRGLLGPHLMNGEAVDHLCTERYTVVTWNCVPRDWEAPPSSWVGRARTVLGQQDWTVLVLHDPRDDAMQHLGGFLDALLADGVEFRDDFPDSCTPIRRGVVQRSLAGLTPTTAAA